MELNCKKTTQNILKDLPERTRAVISRRFALGKSSLPETLDAIGKSYNITRERVRQIEADGIKRAKKSAQAAGLAENFKSIQSYFDKKLEDCGGARTEKGLLEEIGREEKNCALFLLSLMDSIFPSKEDDDFNKFFATGKGLIAEAEKLSAEIVALLKEKGSPMMVADIFTEMKKKGERVKKENIACYFEISKKVAKTVSGGKIGLKSWPEVNPKTVKDKIRLVLKESNKPLHFKEIADSIFGLNVSLPDQKKTRLHPQTVHNELIRNEDFVLVGRGYYALRDWGYNPGQVKDVIRQVLKASDMPMAKEEVIQAVLKQRMVKESTVLLNLQNKNLFEKSNDGRYNIREA